jgi:hypothetical protein
MLQGIGASFAISHFKPQANQAAAALQSAAAASSQALQDILTISQQGLAASISGGEGGIGTSAGEGCS